MFLNPSSKAFRINFRKSLKAKSLFCSKDVLSNASLEKEAPKETLPHNLSFIKPFQKLRNYHNTNKMRSFAAAMKFKNLIRNIWLWSFLHLMKFLASFSEAHPNDKPLRFVD
ncbi:hypothetical protein NPIL_429311 [Nephila pilipes]|uniref:Uncharacterized protein n=1 Tax=Nephila pilipes TaxID=299642 RepID=A0A8X6Q6K1_NEPPI|nr:hypothetical protein NPIL_429311 [Nephila pilipes]